MHKVSKDLSHRRAHRRDESAGAHMGGLLIVLNELLVCGDLGRHSLAAFKAHIRLTSMRQTSHHWKPNA